MQKLTTEQAVVLTGFTGVMCCEIFSDFHKDLELRIGRPVFTHELPSLTDKIKELYKNDFMVMCGVAK